MIDAELIARRDDLAARVLMGETYLMGIRPELVWAPDEPLFARWLVRLAEYERAAAECLARGLVEV